MQIMIISWSAVHQIGLIHTSGSHDDHDCYDNVTAEDIPIMNSFLEKLLKFVAIQNKTVCICPV